MSILLDRLTKRLGRALVVDRVSLETKEGELLVLLGRSGSGKTTVLRMIAGLVRPDAGRIVLHGQDVTHAAPQERGTGFVFQNYSVFRHMTVAENVEFGLRLRGEKKAERRARREELLELVSLSGLGDRYPHELSGGQQQRVALARALAYRPGVLLLDEPFGALDAGTRTQLRRALREIQRRVGVSTVLVTHDQDEAFELGDRIGVMDGGRLVEVDAPESLYRAPRTSFAAVFVGSGNVFVGRVAGGTLRIGAIGLPIPASAPHEEGAPARVLVRPEQVSLTASEPEPGAFMLGKGVVIEQRFGGASRRVRLALPHAKGIRQLAPVPPFGEERLLVDALLPSELDVNVPEWCVSVRGWHVLQQAKPRVLAIHPLHAPAPSMAATSRIAHRMDATVTLLGFAREDLAAARLRDTLHDAVTQSKDSRLDVRVRTGDVAEQLAFEQHEVLYDLVLVARKLRRGGLSETCSAVLEAPRSPVLVLVGEPERLDRVLIATAAGRPGETAVRRGGWIARRLGARVTLLHVLRTGREANRFVQAHLARATATLRAMDVESQIRLVAAATPSRGILDEAASGGHDLVVLGHHHGSSRSLFARDDVPMQVLLSSKLPVVIVPTEEAP
jgi:sulfate transport system ATP-binding protein